MTDDYTRDNGSGELVPPDSKSVLLPDLESGGTSSDRRGKPIGVFDSGIGGLTVVRELIEKLPGEEIIYFGDTARLPYGTKSPEAVLRFARENLAFLKSKDVKLIVVACNTASSLALPRLDKEDIPLVGVLLPGARGAAAVTRNGRVAVIGTTATIHSRAYENALQGINPTLAIWSKACPLFVSLVEEGWLEDDITLQVAQRYLETLPDFGADTLVLGCTHYPLLKKVISRVVGDGITLVDSARETAIEVERVLEETGLKNDREGGGSISVFVSDIPYLFKQVGERFLGRPLERVEHL
ncbi:MAG: glutamate racemase [Candidatus Krumholzibacteriota bacterium]|nr:glutamate racemase [Candidatus Krumholzibacteriota bacterium]